MQGVYGLVAVVVFMSFAWTEESGQQPFLTSSTWSSTQGLIVGSEEHGLFQVSDPDLQFTRFPGISDIKAIVCVRAGPSGDLWIGTADQGLVVVGDGGIRRLDVLHGFPGNHIWKILLDPSMPGAWVCTEGGLAMVSEHALTWTMLGAGDGLPCPGITTVARWKNTVCIGTECGGLVLGQVTKAGLVTLDRVIANAQDGHLAYAPLPSNCINDVLCDASGTWWIATTQGLVSTNNFVEWWIWLANDAVGSQIFSTLNATQLKRVRTRNLTETYCTRIVDSGSGGILIGHRTSGFDRIVTDREGNIVRSAIIDRSADAEHYAKDGTLLPDGRMMTVWYGGGVVMSPAGRDVALSKRSLPFHAIRMSDLDHIEALSKRIASLGKQVPSPGVVAIPDDWMTKGDWIGHYGRWWASLEAIISPESYLWGAWPTPIIFERDIARKDFASATPDALRFWVHWLYTTNPNSLELPPAYRHLLQAVGQLPGYATRRQAECDDHGEAYPAAFDGPHIAYRLQVPAGSYFLSFYDYNKDGQLGMNRLRDYVINLYQAQAETALRPESYRKLPLVARARIHDFRPGVYKRFVATGPMNLIIEVNRSHSFNTIMSGVFLDPTEDLPAPWLEKSTLAPEYLCRPVLRPRQIEPTPILPTYLQQLERAIGELKGRAILAWGSEQRVADAYLLKEIGAGVEVRLGQSNMERYWQNTQFQQWDTCHEACYGATPRSIWQAVRSDDSTGSGRGRSLLLRSRQ